MCRKTRLLPWAAILAQDAAMAATGNADDDDDDINSPEGGRRASKFSAREDSSVRAEPARAAVPGTTATHPDRAINQPHGNRRRLDIAHFGMCLSF